MNGTANSPRWSLAAGAFVFTFLALLSPLLLLYVEPTWDALQQFLPAFTYLADAARSQSLPLWDPFTNCGYPYHAEPQFNTFNPVAILLAVLIDRPSVAFVLFWTLHWLWGGLGMMVLSRYFGASPVGALAAAVSYALCGFFVAHAQHTSYILVAGWLPWVLAFADRAVRDRNPAYALLAGAAMGLSALGGYPGMILFSALALAIWLCLLYGLPRSSSEGRIGYDMLWIVITLAVVALLLVMIWSPILNAFFVEGHGYTDRTGALDSKTANLGDPFSLSAAISVFFPFATVVGSEWMGADISMTNGYMGILAVPLASLWLLRSSDRRKWGLMAFAVLMVAISAGGEYGPRGLLYHVYPPLQYMRFSAPFRLFWMLPVILCSGLALSRLISIPEERRMLLKLVALWFLLSLAAGTAFMLLIPVAREELVPFLAKLYLPQAVILCATLCILWFFTTENGWRRGSFVPLLIAILVFTDMALHLYTNEITVWSREGVVGKLEEMHRRGRSYSGAPPSRLPGAPFGYLNAQQVVKIPIVGGYVTMKSEGFDQILTKSRFLEILTSPQRFWLSPAVEHATSAEHALSVLSTIGSGVPVPVFVSADETSLPGTRAVPGSYGSVNILSYAPERVELAVSVPAGKPAFLTSSERYAAGWKVYVDGDEQKVLKSNLYFRGALIPAGEHRVVWKYNPPRLQWLLRMSYLALIVAPSLAIFLLWRERRLALAAYREPALLPAQGAETGNSI